MSGPRVPRAADVEEAAARLAGVVSRTPLTFSERLSVATGARVLLKREDLQPVRSYKLRGAYNFIAQLDDAARAAGVMCASAGNHGQGVAMSCRLLGIRGTVFVPATTPRQKIGRMQALGGRWLDLRIVGDTYDDAAGVAAAEAAANGATLVPAFDAGPVIAGQGTVAREILEQMDEPPDVLLVPVGGGGMLAGCVALLSERAPGTRVVGVEPRGARSLGVAVESGAPVTLDHIDTFVDGAAVRRVGDLPFATLAGHDVALTTVTEGAVCQEMLDLYQVDGVIAEPAGALACAALDVPGRPGPVRVTEGQTVVAILSGGNNDVSRYGEIVERALVHEGRKHHFMVNFPQEPGALRRFLDEVLGPTDDITLFEYVKRNNRETGPALVGIELASADDLPALLDRMAHSPMLVEKLESDSQFYRFLI
ncbi:MAG: threonine ammonia-lyase IlvA [Thermoleophilia bacterium]|nr:threonine ammonia-lyase IlvA [Thermoleophilia bacterium]